MVLEELRGLLKMFKGSAIGYIHMHLHTDTHVYTNTLKPTM